MGIKTQLMMEPTAPNWPTQEQSQSTPGSVDVVRQADPRLAQALCGLMQSRRTILPKRLAAPGPNATQMQQILAAAASAPDHGQTRPWRFVVIPTEARTALAKVFGEALLERDPSATPEQVLQAQEKAHRSPLLFLAIVDARSGDRGIDLHERIVSVGCAIQNMLLMATALGFGSALTSGKALKSAGLRALFSLTDGDHALCFVSIGTAQSAKKSPHPRPEVGDYVRTLSAPPGWC